MHVEVLNPLGSVAGTYCTCCMCACSWKVKGSETVMVARYEYTLNE